jgi:hypothetical protein
MRTSNISQLLADAAGAIAQLPNEERLALTGFVETLGRLIDERATYENTERARMDLFIDLAWRMRLWAERAEETADDHRGTPEERSWLREGQAFLSAAKEVDRVGMDCWSNYKPKEFVR